MYKEIYDKWKTSDKLSDAQIKELISIEDQPSEIEYRFGCSLSFGTAGMRGIIGLGTNMMNIFTVRQATQGLADYIKSLGKKAIKRGVVISYDTRRMSYEFAYNTAVVLVSNGIKTYLFNDVHPVPMLSYAVRKLKAVAGVMITASHNPKEYNGYKVYGEDGAQMSPEATEVVVDYINKVGDPLSDNINYDEKLAKRIVLVGKNIDKTYYNTIYKLCLSKREVKKVSKTVKLVYTPIHGSGYIPVTTILKKMGIKPILVPEQLNKDTEFSTVKVPNPEYKETLLLGIKLADFKNCDVVFGTDPDCDRLGVAVRNAEGEFIALSGNQVGLLLLDYVLRRLKEQGKLPANGFVVKSFVSAGMAKLIADDYGVELFDVPVGFKFIGEKIKKYDDTGKRKFLFGFEESCGYLRGTHCRDKDAVVASMLFAEMVCYYNANNIGIFDRLNELYDKYGYNICHTDNIQYSGLNAMADMNAVVDKMKSVMPKTLGGFNVVAMRDYSIPQRKSNTGLIEDIDCSPVNAVYYELFGGGFVCIRPSGTEPKLKIYYSLNVTDKESAENSLNAVKTDVENYMK